MYAGRSASIWAQEYKFKANILRVLLKSLMYVDISVSLVSMWIKNKIYKDNIVVELRKILMYVDISVKLISM